MGFTFDSMQRIGVVQVNEHKFGIPFSPLAHPLKRLLNGRMGDILL